MKCQKCGADIPEGKIYCESCGTAIQMVPDYNPVDDISIGAEENKIQTKPKTVENAEATIPEQEKTVWYYRWRHWIAAAVLVIGGILAFQFSYRSILRPEAEAAEPEETIFLERPEFSVEPGTYDYSPQLKISHADRENGVIYYTTDGTTPDAGSQIYNQPIALSEGKTILRAIFIRSDGAQSEEADGTYEVVFDYPEEPSFSVPGGDYLGGFSVSLTAEPGCKIYYTTNGEEPDIHSRLYQGPIEINPGLTVLQAISVDSDGGESGIVEAIYNVKENFMPEELPEELPPEATIPNP